MPLKQVYVESDQVDLFPFLPKIRFTQEQMVVVTSDHREKKKEGTLSHELRK